MRISVVVWSVVAFGVVACGDGATGSSMGSESSTAGRIDCGKLDPRGPILGGGPLGLTDYPPPCDPRTSGDGAYTCCSDDPAAPGGALPEYQGKSIPGEVPYFAGANNAVGSSGVCVKTGDIPFGSGLEEPAAYSCPVPCDPRWEANEVETVCGQSRVCCQTQEVRMADCVQDPADGRWRAVRGADIAAAYDDGTPVTTWEAGEHATQQDGGLEACRRIGGGDVTSDAFRACTDALSVADGRGFCMALGPGQMCPLEQPTYVDVCEQLND